jgi:hypothetical protein
MHTAADAQMFYVMLVLPALFGLTLVGEGVFKMWHYESGWGSVFLGCLFLAIVTFGYFYLRGLL